MYKYRLIPILVLFLAACHDTPESVLAPGEVVEEKTADVHTFEAELLATNHMTVPAWALGLYATDFWGRCSEPAIGVSAFQIQGQVPQVGTVWGSVSHCAYPDPQDPTKLQHGDGAGWLRAANGDDLFFVSENGTTLLVDGSPSSFQNEWTFGPPGLYPNEFYQPVVGTGRFQSVQGSGTAYGEYGPATQYRMSGTIDYEAADRSSGANFLGTFRMDMAFPYAGGWDPCWDENEDWSYEHDENWTWTVMVGEGTATHLGPFTTHGEFCVNWLTGESEKRIHHGVTATGDTFVWDCDWFWLELPVFVPGVERVYTYRGHEVMTVLSGPFEGYGVEINSAGLMWPTWQLTEYGPVPSYPWKAEQHLAGTWARR
jgi:hypothetical protein